MAQGKPKIAISNFTGMGDNGSFWLEGFDIKKYGGNGVLAPGDQATFMYSNATSGYSTMTNLVSWDKFISTSTSDASVICIGPNSGVNTCIFSINPFDYTSDGLIYTSQVAANNITYFPGIITTNNGNILFANNRYLGIGYYGTSTGGSATSLVDSTKDFDALGFGTTTGRNKIYNITKKEARTITVALNDTLTFASGTTYAASDKYCAFYEDKFDLGAGSQFVGQVATSEFKRQIVSFNDSYYILNGNWLAKLNSDESTFDNNHKQLPSRTQAMCFSHNQDKMIVGCEVQGRGRLLLWDGYASGWQSKQELPSPIQAIIPYETGFVFLMGNSLYFTDGYSYKIISSIPGANSDYTAYAIFSSLMYANNKFYIGGIVEDLNRVLSGVYSFDINKGWFFSPLETSSAIKSYKSVPMSMFYASQIYNQVASESAVMFSSYSDGGFEINKIRPGRAGQYRSVILYIELPQKTNISSIELNLSSGISTRGSSDASSTVYVNYAEINSDLISYATVNSPSTTTTFKNSGYTFNKKVGDVLLFKNGSVSGQRSYITSISDEGTSSEVITFSPAVSVAPSTGDDVMVLGLKSAGYKTINDNEIPREISYTVPSFYSDKLMVEVYINGSSSLEIHSINIY